MTNDAHIHSPAIATVDAVVLTMENGQIKALLHKRPEEPFREFWALPGGFIRTEDASAEAAVARVLRDKAGASGFWVEQLATFSGPDRDPRGWSLSIAYIAVVPLENLPEISETVQLFDVEELPALAFDHARILAEGVRRLRGKGAYSTLPAKLLPPVFTLKELQGAYEAALGHPIEQATFRRKISDLRVLDELRGELRRGEGRPSQLYTLSADAQTFDRSLGGSV